MVSICILTLDRFEILKQTLEKNLFNAGIYFELLVCDNGSTDKRIEPFIDELLPSVFIKNSENKGVAPMFNELMNKAKGDYICMMGNDIIMSDNWLQKLVEASNKLPDAGMVAGFCVAEKGEKITHEGIEAYQQWNAFGTCLISRKVFESVGYFNNKYAPYGLEDSDYHFRLNRLGFKQYYIEGITSNHIGNDTDSDSEYRKMKWASLEKNTGIFNHETSIYDSTNNYYLPFNQ